MKPEPEPKDEETGLLGLRNWRRVYAFVLITFAVWIGLLLALTRAYS